MLYCVLFVVSTGVGFANDNCVRRDGLLKSPSQIVYLVDMLPNDLVVTPAPQSYVNLWRIPFYVGSEYSHGPSLSRTHHRRGRTRSVSMPAKYRWISTNEWVIRSGSGSRWSRDSHRGHSRHKFGPRNSSKYTLEKRRRRHR